MGRFQSSTRPCQILSKLSESGLVSSIHAISSFVKRGIFCTAGPGTTASQAALAIFGKKRFFCKFPKLHLQSSSRAFRLINTIYYIFYATPRNGFNRPKVTTFSVYPNSAFPKEPC